MFRKFEIKKDHRRLLEKKVQKYEFFDVFERQKVFSYDVVYLNLEKALHAVASKHNLSNLKVLVDYNKIQSYDFVKDCKSCYGNHFLYSYGES